MDDPASEVFELSNPDKGVESTEQIYQAAKVAHILRTVP